MSVENRDIVVAKRFAELCSYVSSLAFLIINLAYTSKIYIIQLIAVLTVFSKVMYLHLIGVDELKQIVSPLPLKYSVFMVISIVLLIMTGVASFILAILYVDLDLKILYTILGFYIFIVTAHIISIIARVKRRKCIHVDELRFWYVK